MTVSNNAAFILEFTRCKNKKNSITFSAMISISSLRILTTTAFFCARKSDKIETQAMSSTKRVRLWAWAQRLSLRLAIHKLKLRLISWPAAQEVSW